MQINLSNIKRELNNLNKLEEAYENVYLNYYNNIKNIENEWNGIYEQRFMHHVDEEKQGMSVVYNNILNLNSLYGYICDAYSDIGEKIIINFSKKDMITNKINSCMNHVRQIISMCNNINTTDFTDYELSVLNNVRSELQQLLPKMGELKNNIVNIFDKVEKIESDIRNVALKTNIDTINESDISDCVEKQ